MQKFKEIDSVQVIILLVPKNLKIIIYRITETPSILQKENDKKHRGKK